MSENTDLPIHPRTGLRALGVLPSGRIVWPIFGASEEHGGGDGGDGGAGGPGTGPQGGGDGGGNGGDGNGGDGTKPTETVDFWKGKSRDWELKSKANSKAASDLAELQGKYATAEAEAASVPVKIAEALKAHLTALHGIDSDDAELLLTATDPETLLKQVDRLLEQSGKRKNKNHVSKEGANSSAGSGNGEMSEFVSQLFGNDK